VRGERHEFEIGAAYFSQMLAAVTDSLLEDASVNRMRPVQNGQRSALFCEKHAAPI
jgi:hypothetical protein